MPEHRLVSDDEFQRIEVITGGARRRRWSAEQKLRIVEESLRSSDSVSVVARRHGVAPNLLFRWRRLASEGGAAAVTADDGVTSNAEVRRGPAPCEWRGRIRMSGGCEHGDPFHVGARFGRGTV